MKPLLPFLFLIPAFAFSQGQFDNWYFGQNVGINFTSSPPTLMTGSDMGLNEGYSTISYESGELLFYTDGDTVWNRNHIPMPNGTGLLGHESSTQSVLIVKQPYSNSIYYIFTTDAGENQGLNGLRYSIVDIALDGGLGNVYVKNRLLFTPVSEKLTAVTHENESDVWIMTHDYDSTSFLAYQLSSFGLDTIPQTSSLNPDYDPLFDPVGQMKFSPDGEFLACCNPPSEVNLYKFDNSSGLLTNRIVIPLASYTSMPYGVAYSEDSKNLYVAGIFAPTIVQLNLSVFDSTQISNSIEIVGISSSQFVTQLQLAPDGRIYVGKLNGNSPQSYLGVITTPNLSGVACNYVDNGFDLGSPMNIHGLPNFNQSYLAPNTIGVRELKPQQTFSVHPNPGSEKFSIEAEFKLKHISIFNPQGQLMWKSESQRSKYSVDCSQWPDGIYVIQSVSDGRLRQQKLVVSH